MINGALYRRGMRGSVKLLLILAAVLAMYVVIIVSMYEPEMAQLLDSYVELMPEIMAAVGMTGTGDTLAGFMTAGTTSLMGFLCSYLYGFLLLIFPMLFCILRGNGLVAKYVDDSSMVSLLSAPVRRSTIALTQGAVMVSGTLILTVYITALEWFSGEYYFPGQLDLGELLQVNAGLFCLHLCLGGICFFASCLFSETKYSLGVGAGLPILMYVFQMMANMGGKAENAKYFTVFTLFQPEELAAGESGAVAGALVLLALGIVLYGAAVAVFTRKDLHI